MAWMGEFDWRESGVKSGEEIAQETAGWVGADRNGKEAGMSLEHEETIKIEFDKPTVEMQIIGSVVYFAFSSPEDAQKFYIAFSESARTGSTIAMEPRNLRHKR